MSENQVPPSPAPPKKKSSYASFAENSTRNVVWALGLTMAVVILVAIVHFGFGSTVKREVPEDARVDVPASAERARGSLPFVPAVPDLPSSWTARQAKLVSGDTPQWTAEYTSPGRARVQLVQVSKAGPEQLNAVLSGAHPDGEREVGSVTCTVMTGKDDTANGDGASALLLLCPAAKSSVIVSGSADLDELATFADAAIASTTRD